MDELGNRLQPQHLIDEVLGFFRSSGENGDSKFAHLRENIAHGASSAAHSLAHMIRRTARSAPWWYS